jgi:hypothetical protein
MRLNAHGILYGKKLVHVGIRLRRIAEDKRTVPAGFDARGFLPFGKLGL